MTNEPTINIKKATQLNSFMSAAFLQNRLHHTDVADVCLFD